MASSSKIYATARDIVDQYGDDAPIEAALRHDEFAELGDQSAAETWRGVTLAIDELMPSKALKGS